MMNSYRARGLLVTILTMAPGFFQALSAVPIDDNFQKYALNSDLQYFLDEKATLSFPEIQRKPATDWRPMLKSSFGQTKTRVWLKLEVSSTRQEETSLVLEVGYPALEKVMLYETTARDARVSSAGTLFAGAGKPLLSLAPAFQVSLPAGGSKTFYLAVESSRSSLYVPVALFTHDAFREKTNKHLFFFGGFFSLIVFVFIYALFLWILTRQVMYGYFMVFVLSFGLGALMMTGVGGAYLWNSASPVNRTGPFALYVIYNSALWLFAVDYLRIKVTHRGMVRAIKAFVALNLAIFLAIIMGGDHIFPGVILVENLVIAAEVVVMLTFCGILAFNGNRSALIFLLGWSVFFFGFLGRLLMMQGMLPSNIFFEWSYVSAPALGIAILSMALGSRLRVLQGEKENAQSDALAAREESRQVIEETHRRVFSNMHDHVGAYLLDLQLKVQSWREKKSREEICLDQLKTDIDSLVSAFRSGIDHVDDLFKISRDFAIGLQVFALRRYSGSGRRLLFNSEGFPNDLRVHEDLVIDILSIVTEIISNDLKYGNGPSEWTLSVNQEELAVIEMKTRTEFDPQYLHNGHGMTSIHARARKISAEIEAEQATDFFRFKIHFPLRPKFSLG